jgi:hypothetical protein
MSHGILGNLVVNFRNRKYMFLHSMKMVDQGNRYAIYELATMLAN